MTDREKSLSTHRRELLVTLGASMSLTASGCLNNSSNTDQDPPANSSEKENEVTSQYIINGLTLSQHPDAAGILQIELNSTVEGSPREMAKKLADTINFHIERDGATDTVEIERQGSHYRGEAVVMEEGPITVTVPNPKSQIGAGDSIVITEPPQVTGFNLQLLSWEDVYRSTFEDIEPPVDNPNQQLKYFEDGKIVDIGQLVKEANLHVSGDDNRAAWELRKLFHDQIGMDTDDIRVYNRRGSVSGVSVMAIEYREDGELKKAMGYPWDTDNADEMVVLPGAEDTEYSSKREQLDGLFDVDESSYVMPQEYEGNRESIRRSWVSLKDYYTEEEILNELKSGREETDENLDYLLTGVSESQNQLHLTPEAAKRLEEAGDPNSGDHAVEWRGVEAATEFWANRLRQGEYMELGYSSEEGFTTSIRAEEPEVEETFELGEDYLKPENLNNR